MNTERIEYVSSKGYKGILYDPHMDMFAGENYQMVILDKTGREILHSYNAKPKTEQELKKVVDLEEKHKEEGKWKKYRHYLRERLKIIL